MLPGSLGDSKIGKAMGETGGKVLNWADEHDKFATAIVLIAGVGLLVGLALGQAQGVQVGTLDLYKVALIGMGGTAVVSYGIFYGIAKLLGKKVEDKKIYKTLMKIPRAVFLTLAIGAIALGGGMALAQTGGMPVLMATVVAGGSLGIGSLLLLAFLNEKQGHKAWVRTLNKVLRVSLVLIAPLAYAGFIVLMMHGGGQGFSLFHMTARQEFWYGLALSPLIVPLVGSGVLALLKPRQKRIRTVKTLPKAKLTAPKKKKKKKTKKIPPVKLKQKESVESSDDAEKKPQDPTSLLKPFYEDRGKDAYGRSYETLMAMRGKDSQLESTHNYIQWLFPLPEGGLYKAPAPSKELLADLAKERQFQARAERAFVMMLEFYGFKPKLSSSMERDWVKLEYHPDWEKKTENWLKLRKHGKSNHNWLRITRILKFMTLIGQQEKADLFLKALVEFIEEDPRIRENKHLKEQINLSLENFWKPALKVQNPHL